MTPDKILDALADIRAAAGDDEVAHGLEDSLWEAVLRTIAAGHPESQRMAQLALRTKDINFCRWRA